LRPERRTGSIARLASQHGEGTFMTRNTKHFEASGALVINPWQGS
jgi:hypothetical protein